MILSLNLSYMRMTVVNSLSQQDVYGCQDGSVGRALVSQSSDQL